MLHQPDPSNNNAKRPGVTHVDPTLPTPGMGAVAAAVKFPKRCQATPDPTGNSSASIAP